MKNILLSVAVVAALIASGVGGTFAGFIDTEVSEDNFIQAGISDLLVNGVNNPEAKIQFVHAAPCKSVDFWIDLYNWGECQGGDVYMHFKDVESIEDGVKVHMGDPYVWDGTDYIIGSPVGAGVASSEPELLSEEGDGYIAQLYIAPDPALEPGLMGTDYASGISDHTGVSVEVPLVGAAGNQLGNPDTNGDGFVDPAEYAAWVTAGNRWSPIASLNGKLSEIECEKNHLGFLKTQNKTFVHVDLHLQQIEDPLYPRDYDLDGDIDADDAQKRFWPTNALQGDLATWSMLFELITDP
jgi:hypothetical protein